MRFRIMTDTDIPSGLALCRSAGWNQLSRDWEAFLEFSPVGNRVCVGDDDSVIGTVTTICYPHSFAWIGMLLVHPDHRRKGVGLQLLQQACEVLKNKTCVKLDATPAGREVYLKFGFRDEYGLSRMKAGSVNRGRLIARNPVHALTANDLESVKALDREYFGAERMSLLSWMLDGAPELAFRTHDEKGLTGYCLGRYGHHSTHIGPVVARHTDAAKALVSAALRNCGNNAVILDVPHHDPAWKEWLISVGFSEQRPFIRMYKGSNSEAGDPEQQFAILGPEFG